MNELMNMDSFNTMAKQADILIKSGFLPKTVNTPEKAITIMMKGNELNIPYLEALSGINIIQGKPTVAPQLMLGMARRTGQLEDLKISYDAKDTCQVVIKRRGETAHVESFGKNEAQAMGLIGKDNYKKQAKVMYKWRALSANLRITFADVVCGMYTHEEVHPDLNYNSDGELKEGQIDRLKNITLDKEVTNVFDDKKKEELPPAVISQDQIKRLFTIGGVAGLSNEALRPIIKARGYESTKEINVSDYDAIIADIEACGEIKKNAKESKK